jgi:DNA-binding transcriptional MocR family regulator
MAPTPAPNSATLYEQVAQQIARQIEEGAFGPGERVPSIRQLSRRQAVSVATVLEAYRLLEDQGWIEPRPQSGYFVSARAVNRPAEPEPSNPGLDPTEVSIGELSIRVLRDSHDPSRIQLGAAAPNPALLPIDRLQRIAGALGREMPERVAAYDAPPGCKELRVQIARRSLEAGCEVRPEEIVTTTGCQEALVLCLRAVCRPGDTVAIESPSYYGVLQAIQSLGLNALELPTHPQDGLSLEALRRALDQHPVRACIMSNFNNPLGSCMPDEARRELVELLAAREIPLIEDDVYGELCGGASRARTAKAYDRHGLVLLCSSVSKTLAPGYRVGWVAPGRFFREVEHLKVFSSFATVTLTQLAVAELLRTGGYDRHLRRVRSVYAQQVAQMAQAVGKHFPAGTRVTRPSGGFVLWVQLPPGGDSLQLYQLALRDGVTFAPGPIFSAAGGYRDFLRLNAAVWSEEVQQAVARLGQLAHS